MEFPIWEYHREMRIVARKTLQNFYLRHAEVKEPLEAWYQEAEASQWRDPSDIKSRYPSASFLHNNRVVFNIKGNKYRLIVAVAYRLGVVYIKFVGTHAEYDKIDASTIEVG